MENLEQKILRKQLDNSSENIENELTENEQEVREIIKEVLIERNSLGKGQTAEVFVREEYPDVCYKLIYNKNIFYNPTEKEAVFLTEVRGLHEEVHVPEAYYAGNINDEEELLVMERLHAVSVKDLIEEDMEIPENFNFHSFFRALSDFFDKMHEQKKIFHRDAHWGNIMIDLKTGKPCVIDFGAAKKEHLSSSDPYNDNKAGSSETTFFTPDEVRLQEVKSQLKDYILSKRN